MANKRSKHLDYDKAETKGRLLIAKEDQLGLFILIALETGLRCGDILKLNKQDFFSEGSKLKRLKRRMSDQLAKHRF